MFTESLGAQANFPRAGGGGGGGGEPWVDSFCLFTGIYLYILGRSAGGGGGGVILGGSAQQGGVAKKKKSPDFRCLEVGTSAATMSTHVLPVVVDVASECTVDV